MTNDKKSKANALQEAKQVEKSIEEALQSVQTGESTKDMIVAGYLSLAMQHHSSIILLIENNLPSSAVALKRPLVEATYRGTWFALIAKNKQAEDFNAGDFTLKKTYKLAKDIDREIKGDSFHYVYEQNSPILHAMTHGGIEQISRQFSKDAKLVIPTFEDEELIEIINASNMNLLMMLLAFGVNIDDSEIMLFARKLILSYK